VSSVKKRRWWQNLNRALFPFMGPAQLGPFDEPPLPSTAGKPCPICGQPMDQHTIERSGTAATRLHCPV
jgi:hypothetical protein